MKYVFDFSQLAAPLSHYELAYTSRRKDGMNDIIVASSDLAPVVVASTHCQREGADMVTELYRRFTANAPT